MATLSISDRIPIPNTEASVPSLGFGTYYIDGTDCEAACLTAFRAGYRHIDTAQSYRNEANVGKAVGQAGLKREDVFLTSKLGRTQNSVDETYKSILGSVEKLGGYIDLFLIHQPGAKDSRKDIWAALEKLYAEGKVKAIGVSNFRVRHLQEMKEYATVWPPHVNQIEVIALPSHGVSCTNRFTASPLEPTARAGRLLHCPRHCRPGLQPSSNGHETRRPRRRRCRDQARQAARAGADPLGAAEGLGAAAQERDHGADRVQRGRVRLCSRRRRRQGAGCAGVGRCGCFISEQHELSERNRFTIGIPNARQLLYKMVHVMADRI